MHLVLVFTTLATAFNGLLAGINTDTSLVKLPTRRRIGNVAYATFARGNDLGGAFLVYPPLGIGAAVLTILTAIVALVMKQPMGHLLPLIIASLLSGGHSFATTQAAPTIMSIGPTPDDEALLKQRLDRFERWQAVRAAFQVPTFFVLLWAMIVVR
jgi:hypothetical protein